MQGRILFLLNPTSTTINKDEIEPLISEYAFNHRFEWKVLYTVKDNSERYIKESIKEYKPDIVVAGGGDGTINQVASQLTGSEIELGIIPAGSANGLAYNLNIPFDIERALDMIFTAGARPVDVIRINDRINCLHLSDIGINARIVKRFEQEGCKGLPGYAWQMVKELFAKKSIIKLQMNVDGRIKKYKAEMLVIANARSYGTGAVINPLGKPDDGEFEIVILRIYPWWILFYLLRMFISGKLDKLKYVKVIRTTSAEIILDKPYDLQSDGEITKGVTALRVKILPSALKVRYIKN